MAGATVSKYSTNCNIERSLLTPEIRCSNPVIGKVFYTKYSTNCNIENPKMKKRGRERPIFKIKIYKKFPGLIPSIVNDEQFVFLKFNFCRVSGLPSILDFVESTRSTIEGSLKTLRKICPLITRPHT